MNSLFNANGVSSSSPGLRGTRYPGTSSDHASQPQRGCAPCDVATTNPDGTALRFNSSTAPDPRVGLIAFGQPWAEGRKPVGLMDSNTNGISSCASHRSGYLDVIPALPSSRSPNANGVPSFSPGLRGTRYPMTHAPHASQPQRGCASCDAIAAYPDGTALRFDSRVTPEPRVALIAFGQPWAGGRKPVGLMDTSFVTHSIN
jgi:hypothetical protein